MNQYEWGDIYRDVLDIEGKLWSLRAHMESRKPVRSCIQCRQAAGTLDTDWEPGEKWLCPRCKAMERGRTLKEVDSLGMFQGKIDSLERYIKDVERRLLREIKMKCDL